MTPLKPFLPDSRAAAAGYAKAKPFPHICFDGFLPENFAKDLWESFPRSDWNKAKNELNQKSLKATNEKLKEISPAYTELEQLFSSDTFLAWLSEVTGIPRLLFDPTYYGGGTHENLPGQELSPHVDFNVHPHYGWYRRVNLLLYLNPEWKAEWGGSLDLHENPWKQSQDKLASYLPSWNRLLLFTTSDSSWHGFQTIRNPENLPAFSRKSVAAYFYTKEPPPHGLRFHHSTIYCERPFPPSFRPGSTLSEEDFAEVTRLTCRRDELLQYLYEREKLFSETNIKLFESHRKLEDSLLRAQHFEKDYYSLLDSHLKMKTQLEADHAALLLAFQQKGSCLEGLLERDYHPKGGTCLTLIKNSPQHYVVANGSSNLLKLWPGTEVSFEYRQHFANGSLILAPLETVLGNKAEPGQATVLQVLGRSPSHLWASQIGGEKREIFTISRSEVIGIVKMRRSWFQKEEPLSLEPHPSRKQKILLKLASRCLALSRILSVLSRGLRGRFLSRRMERGVRLLLGKTGFHLSSHS